VLCSHAHRSPRVAPAGKATSPRLNMLPLASPLQPTRFTDHGDIDEEGGRQGQGTQPDIPAATGFCCAMARPDRHARVLSRSTAVICFVQLKGLRNRRRPYPDCSCIEREKPDAIPAGRLVSHADECTGTSGWLGGDCGVGKASGRRSNCCGVDPCIAATTAQMRNMTIKHA
jgi:hypothetical protein